MIDGSGSEPLTNRSGPGSRRSKNIWIRLDPDPDPQHCYGFAQELCHEIFMTLYNICGKIDDEVKTTALLLYFLKLASISKTFSCFPWEGETPHCPSCFLLVGKFAKCTLSRQGEGTQPPSLLSQPGAGSVRLCNAMEAESCPTPHPSPPAS